MAGGQEGTAGMSIFLSELRRGRRHWSRPRLISRDEQRSEQNPILYVSEDGRLQLIHTAQQVRDRDDQSWQREGTAFSMQWTAALRHQARSLSSSRWSRASDLISDPAFCRHPHIGAATGIGYYLYRSLREGGAFGQDHSEILVLNPDGSSTGQIYPVPESVGRVHGSIVISSDGKSLLQFFRSRLADRIYRSYGSLDGSVWSEPLPTTLPNNNSSIQACRLSSGLLAMIYNRYGLENGDEHTQSWGEANWPRTRWPLSIALSPDDGDTWPWIRDIDTGLGFCGETNWHLNGQLAYPTLLEGNPGELHLAYSWAGRSAIRYVCLEESTIIGESNWF